MKQTYKVQLVNGSCVFVEAESPQEAAEAVVLTVEVQETLGE